MHRAPKLLHDDGQLALAQLEVDDPGSKSRASGLKNIVRQSAVRDIGDVGTAPLRGSPAKEMNGGRPDYVVTP
jgi:hypothetical protein